MPSKNDIEFARLAIAAKYVTATRVKECLAEQKKVEKMGRSTSLDTILFQRGLLTPKQLVELQNKQGRRIIFCGDCRAKLNVFDFEPGSKVKCPKCGSSITVPIGVPQRPDATQAAEPHEEKPPGLASLLVGVEDKKGENKKPSVAKKPSKAAKPAPPPKKKGLVDDDLELIDIDDEPTIKVPAKQESKKEPKKESFDDDDLILLEDDEPKHETFKAAKDKVPPPKPRDPALADTAHDVPSAKKPGKPPSRLGMSSTRSKRK